MFSQTPDTEIKLRYIHNPLINFEKFKQEYKKADFSKKCEKQKKYFIS